MLTIISNWRKFTPKVAVSLHLSFTLWASSRANLTLDVMISLLRNETSWITGIVKYMHLLSLVRHFSEGR